MTEERRVVEAVECADRARGCLLGGALGGEAALPAEWVEPLQARDLIRQVATDLCQPTPRRHDDPVAWEEHARRSPYV